MDPVASRGERLAMRDLLRILARTALILVLGIGLAEIILQGAALFVHDRQAGWRPEAAHRILCLGDSHTYGAMVPAEESYPGHLQRLLDERAPGAYAVVNLGIPGFNTTQVRARLRAALGRYRPEMVIVWCGVNNAWNRGASIGGAGWWSQLDATLGILRTYRLLRVWLHDRTLEGIGAEPMPHQRYEVDQDAHDPYKKFTLRMDGRTERIVLADAGTRADAEVEAEAEEDYRGMVEEARAAGVGIAFVAYPVDHAAFLPANRAVRRVAAAYHVPLVECLRSTNRLPEEQRQLLWAAHPNGAIYGEVARDLVPIVLSRGAVVRSAGDIPGTPLARLVFGENDGSRGPPRGARGERHLRAGPGRSCGSGLLPLEPTRDGVQRPEAALGHHTGPACRRAASCRRVPERGRRTGGVRGLRRCVQDRGLRRVHGTRSAARAFVGERRGHAGLLRAAGVAPRAEHVVRRGGPRGEVGARAHRAGAAR